MYWLWWVGGLVLFFFVNGETSLDYWLGFSVFFVSTTMGWHKWHEWHRREKARRDDLAQRIATDIEYDVWAKKFGKNVPTSTLDEPIILYLRPFESDGLVFVPNPDANFLRIIVPTYSMGLPSTVPMEYFLYRGSVGCGNFIALGERVEVLGAGRVGEIRCDWKELFIVLARRARCIISTPSLHSSTRWELEWLVKEGLCEKTIMLFNNLHINGVGSKYEAAVLAKELRSMGWEINVPLEAGLMINFDERGRVLRSHRNKKYNLESLSWLIREVSKRSRKLN